MKTVNKIWQQAGIHWQIESIINEQANFTKRFAPASRNKHLNKRQRHKLLVLIKPGWNIFIFGNSTAMTPGHYMPTIGIVVAQKSYLFPLNPSIIAHELGHSLSLQHPKSQRRHPFNLMSGRNKQVAPKNKIHLSISQVKKARKQALTGFPHSRKHRFFFN